MSPEVKEAYEKVGQAIQDLHNLINPEDTKDSVQTAWVVAANYTTIDEDGMRKASIAYSCNLEADLYQAYGLYQAGALYSGDILINGSGD